MKPSRLLLLAVVLAASLFTLHSSLAQGPLTGVTGTNGITVAASDVTIDLGGHALIGLAGTRDGVVVSGSRTNVCVRNGTVRGWGNYGVSTMSALNSVLEDLRALSNTETGLRLGSNGLARACSSLRNGCTIKDCTASRNDDDGIVVGTGSSIVDCTSFANPATGNLIIRNSAQGNTTEYDIVAGNADAQVLSPGSGFTSTDPWANFSY